MSNSRIKLSYSFSQAPTHHNKVTPPRVGKGRALAASSDQMGAGELWTGPSVPLPLSVQTAMVSSSVPASRHGPLVSSAVLKITYHAETC